MNTTVGLIMIALGVLTMAMMPIAENLNLSAFQLLVLRGGPAAIVFGLVGLTSRNKKHCIDWPDQNTWLLTIFFLIASLGLFQGVKVWGASLTAVLLDMAVLVNFIFALVRGEKVAKANYILFCAAITGSFFALRVWDVAHLSLSGFLWSLVALVANGLFIEYASKAKQSFPTRVFWLSIGLVLFGGLGSFGETWDLNGRVGLAIWFGVSTGLLNFTFVFMAFQNLKAIWIGILVLAVTPCILVSSWMMNGKVFSADQLFGMILILSSVGSLGYFLNKSKEA